jgi:hypothetical protein
VPILSWCAKQEGEEVEGVYRVAFFFVSTDRGRDLLRTLKRCHRERPMAVVSKSYSKRATAMVNLPNDGSSCGGAGRLWCVVHGAPWSCSRDETTLIDH